MYSIDCVNHMHSIKYVDIKGVSPTRFGTSTIFRQHKMPDLKPNANDKLLFTSFSYSL